ncbi:MAG TPA: prephenate dehydrogenase/arogenate dehydrogenase family protein [Tepidisphaeraceae bacterium]|jgi:prephenate dehydrogenase|nr:prephenate dehydrogenase/arogenate dehydrogenase family protein [Tepidisphaeraceae bacterium]
MLPRQLTILGVGLLGGSIGLAVRSAAPQCRIVGFGQRRAGLDHAVEIGAIDRFELDAAASVAGSDLVILCTPVGLFESILAQIGPALAPGALVTDVGSTKRSIARLGESHLPKGVEFVASHPMAGSEKRGVEFSRADLFQNQLCIVTPTPAAHPDAVDRIEQFWRLLGMRTTRLSPDDHDRLLADVSHLPHLLAAALVAMQEDAGLDLSGKGFLDTTRIAGGDGALWRDIFLDNADNLKAGLRRLRDELATVEKMLDAKSADALRDWLNAAAARRQKLLEKKLREIGPD